MERYCVSCKKKMLRTDIQVLEKKKQIRLILLSNYAICGNKRLNSFKN